MELNGKELQELAKTKRLDEKAYLRRRRGLISAIFTLKALAEMKRFAREA